MAWYDANVANISWLNPKETPGQIFTRGLSAGSMVAQSMARQQELAMEEAAFPLKLQQLDLKNRMDSAQIAGASLDLKEKAAHVDDWMADREKLSDWMGLPDSEVMSATPPPVRSSIGMTLIANRRKVASQNSAVAAQGEMDTMNNKAVEFLRTRGVDVPSKVRANGEPYFDGADIATAGLKLDAREQEQLLATWQQRGDNRLAAIDAQALNAEDLENLRHMNRMELQDVKLKAQSLKTKAESNIQDQARKALFIREADNILNAFPNPYKTAAEKTKALDDLSRKFGIESVKFGAPAPDQTNPKSGMRVAPGGVKRWDAAQGKWVQ